MKLKKWELHTKTLVHHHGGVLLECIPSFSESKSVFKKSRQVENLAPPNHHDGPKKPQRFFYDSSQMHKDSPPGPSFLPHINFTKYGVDMII